MTHGPDGLEDMRPYLKFQDYAHRWDLLTLTLDNSSASKVYHCFVSQLHKVNIITRSAVQLTDHLCICCVYNLLTI